MPDKRIIIPSDLGGRLVFDPAKGYYDVTPLPLQEIPLTLGANVTAGGDNSTYRNVLYRQGRMGYIHLDFVARAINGTVAIIPNTTAKPSRLAETQTFDDGSIWIDAGSSTIQFAGLTLLARYMVNIPVVFA